MEQNENGGQCHKVGLKSGQVSGHLGHSIHGEKLRIYCKCSGKSRKISKRFGYLDLTNMLLKHHPGYFCGEWIEKVRTEKEKSARR